MADGGVSGLGYAPGDHICALYFGVEERDALVIPFLREGLEAGHTCICVVHSTTPSAVLQKMGDDVDVDGCMACQRLEVRPSTEAYLRDGHFDTQEMITFFENFVAKASADGTVVRVTGEGAWAVEGWPGAEDLINYESELNDYVGRYPQMILCLYDLAKVGGSMIVDLMETHPKLVLGGRIIENPYYLSPEEFRASRQVAAPPV